MTLIFIPKLFQFFNVAQCCYQQRNGHFECTLYITFNSLLNTDDYVIIFYYLIHFLHVQIEK